MRGTFAIVMLAARIAHADDPPHPALEWHDITMTIRHRDVAEAYLVQPSGIDVGVQLRSINADGGLGSGRLRLTDLALFDVQAQWAIAKHYELDGDISVIAKQPSDTAERLFQGGSLVLRRELAERTALAVGGSASPLLGMPGFAAGGSLYVMHRHELNDIVSFALSAGTLSTFVRPASGPSQSGPHPTLIEAAAHASILARVPECGCYGAWLGVAYAMPVYHRGNDPVSGMTLAPQPRLGIELGNTVQLADQWDFSVELAIVDRGDLANPATRLPILDGGFDQIQIIVGVSRRFTATRETPRDRHARGE